MENKNKVGRKKITDGTGVRPVQVYYPKNKVEKLGGIEKTREKVLFFLDNLYEKTI